MVKGTTRQVIVVKSPDPDLFDQAIFLIKEKALASGGVSDQELLLQARQVCQQANNHHISRLRNLLWGCLGAAIASIVWLCIFLI